MPDEVAASVRPATAVHGLVRDAMRPALSGAIDGPAPLGFAPAARRTPLARVAPFSRVSSTRVVFSSSFASARDYRPTCAFPALSVCSAEVFFTPMPFERVKSHTLGTRRAFLS